MTQSAIATAADYADAMFTARKAKNWLANLLILMLAIQLSLFFMVRYRIDISAQSGAPTLGPVHYVIGLIDFLGVAFALVLAIILLLFVNIMLVGRLIGVSRLVSAFVWSLVLIVFLFPWQAFLNNYSAESPPFKIPGVLYSWNELAARARCSGLGVWGMFLFWARFVGFPIFAIGLLIVVQWKSRRGLRMALGEDRPPSPPATLAVV